LALIYLSGAWVAGIFIGSRLSLPFALIFVGLSPLPLLFFLPHWRRLIIIAAVCLIALFGGALCYQASQPPEDGSHIKHYLGEEFKDQTFVV